MTLQLDAAYLAAGANRHPSAADWDASGILAFGADRNIALWRPQVRVSSMATGDSKASKREQFSKTSYFRLLGSLENKY
jgi:hypothetical protein